MNQIWIIPATKWDLKSETDVDTLQLAKKADLAILKLDVDELDIDRLKNVSVNLFKLNNVVDNAVVKKTMYYKFFTKVNAIDTSRFLLKTQYNNDNSGLEKKIGDANKKISDTSGLVKKTDNNTMITEIEGKIPSITGLATTAVLNAIENKIINVSNIVKKNCGAKILDIESKYFTTSDYLIIINLRIEEKIKIKEKELLNKSDISGGFIDNSNLDKKIATLATKEE